MTDHADTIRRLLASDTQDWLSDAERVALHALLAELQQAQEEADELRIKLAAFEDVGLVPAAQLRQAIDALREIAEWDSPEGEIARAALVQLGEQP